jgi:hypothetical protein
MTSRPDSAPPPDRRDVTTGRPAAHPAPTEGIGVGQSVAAWTPPPAFRVGRCSTVETGEDTLQVCTFREADRVVQRVAGLPQDLHTPRLSGGR